MKVEHTKYGQPVITPEIMDFVGRRAIHTCDVKSGDKERKEIEIDFDAYDVGHLPVAMSEIEDWFHYNVRKSTEIDDPSEFKDEGYFILYKAIEEEPLDIVLNIASGKMTLCSHYVLNLEYFLQTYIESLVEQADLPEGSIVLDRGALFDRINNDKEQGDVVDIPVCIRNEIFYTMGRTPLSAFLCRQLGITPDDKAPAFRCLWSSFCQYTLYTNNHVDNWPFVTCNETYVDIE